MFVRHTLYIHDRVPLENLLILRYFSIIQTELSTYYILFLNNC